MLKDLKYYDKIENDNYTESEIKSMNEKELKMFIFAYVACYKDATFGELKRVLGDVFKGDMVLEHGEVDNLIYWKGMSEIVMKAIIDLLDEKKIVMKPVHHLAYSSSGYILDLPVPEKFIKTGYKKPHWCPVVLCLNRDFNIKDYREI